MTDQENFLGKLLKQFDETLGVRIFKLHEENDRLMRQLKEAQTELEAVRGVFQHGANEEDWIPGTTLAQAVQKIMLERNSLHKNSTYEH